MTVRMHARRSVALLSLTIVLAALSVVLIACPAWSRPTDRDAGLGIRVDEFAGWWHNAGNLLLHVSNRGQFGNRGADTGTPSAEWPAGSANEYLYAAGLWVGGIVGSDTMVTSGLYQYGEFFNHEPDEGCGVPVQGICATAEGAPGGGRLIDDDGDGLVDEDPLDGADNDGDGEIDEDFAAISNQMYRTAYYDSSTYFNQFYPDSLQHHHPLGLAVTQETYVWSNPLLDDFVGVELHIRNASRDLDGVGWTITKPYLGLMVDSDVGLSGAAPWSDDVGAYTEVDTTVTGGSGSPSHVSLRMGYMYDELGGANASDDVPGYLGVLLLGHSIDVPPGAARVSASQGVHAYRIWSSGASDPGSDMDRYRFLRGLSDTGRTINPPATVPADYRYVMSVGPLAPLPPEATLVLQLAFVCGPMEWIVDPNDGHLIRVPDLENPIRAQRVFDGFRNASGIVMHWTASLPPLAPTERVTAGNGVATVEWDEYAESVPDPITGELDFAGYRVERAGPFTGSSLPPSNSWTVVGEWDASTLGEIDTGTPGVGRYAWVDRGLRNFRYYWFRVATVDQSGWTSAAMPVRVRLRAAPEPAPDVHVTPNPWSARVDGESPVRFLDVPEGATIRILGIDGRVVASLESGRAEWMPSASGVYLWRVTDREGISATGKIVVIR